jgi:sulfhydrogenase subunit alpha
MGNSEKKRIEIPEICRVEGHSAVYVEIDQGKVTNVQLDVFEGTRFFEQIVIGHHFEEIPHITSRVCAICSSGHVLAAINAIEHILGFHPNTTVSLFRELLHLGMVIESHATHICALALPDFLNIPDLMEFASAHKEEFSTWTILRNLGSAIQTTVGGRAFHPVNMHVGGISRCPSGDELKPLLEKLSFAQQKAIDLCSLLMQFQPKVRRTTEPTFLALIPNKGKYGFFGDTVKSSDGWEQSIQNYRDYLSEKSVPYSHAKQSKGRGKPLMVGSMARLALFHDLLDGQAKHIYQSSPLASGDTNTILNNLAQAIEVVHAIERAQEIIRVLQEVEEPQFAHPEITKLKPIAGSGSGAVECPRGTLYHYYDIDEAGKILQADMVTPSAQNTARIELDIREVVDQTLGKTSDQLEGNLETLIRAYDPCNTCATHMVSVNYL